MLTYIYIRKYDIFIYFSKVDTENWVEECACFSFIRLCQVAIQDPINSQTQPCLRKPVPPSPRPLLIKLPHFANLIQGGKGEGIVLPLLHSPLTNGKIEWLFQRF